MGDVGNPILYDTKENINKLLDNDFWYYLKIWRRFNLGMGFPDGKAYIHQQEDVVEVVEQFEAMYRNRNGLNIISQKLDGLGEYLRVGFKLKVR